MMNAILAAAVHLRVGYLPKLRVTMLLTQKWLQVKDERRFVYLIMGMAALGEQSGNSGGTKCSEHCRSDHFNKRMTSLVY